MRNCIDNLRSGLIRSDASGTALLNDIRELIGTATRRQHELGVTKHRKRRRSPTSARASTVVQEMSVPAEAATAAATTTATAGEGLQEGTPVVSPTETAITGRCQSGAVPTSTCDEASPGRDRRSAAACSRHVVNVDDEGLMTEVLQRSAAEHQQRCEQDAQEQAAENWVGPPDDPESALVHASKDNAFVTDAAIDRLRPFLSSLDEKCFVVPAGRLVPFTQRRYTGICDVDQVQRATSVLFFVAYSRHWIVARIVRGGEGVKRAMSFWDSYANLDPPERAKKLLMIKQWAATEWGAGNEGAWDSVKWKKEICKEQPHDKNDCALYALNNAKKALSGQEGNFSRANFFFLSIDSAHDPSF